VTVSVKSPMDDSDRFDGVITGVRDPRRLKAVADADLHGSMADPDLDAVVATLRLACAAPMVVVNIVSADRQTYAAEVGVGAECTTVPDALSFCAEVVDTGSGHDGLRCRCPSRLLPEPDGTQRRHRFIRGRPAYR
jgi:hypothetical protein